MHTALDPNEQKNQESREKLDHAWGPNKKQNCSKCRKNTCRIKKNVI
jgi:hypothetical protein